MCYLIKLSSFNIVKRLRCLDFMVPFLYNIPCLCSSRHLASILTFQRSAMRKKVTFSRLSNNSISTPCAQALLMENEKGPPLSQLILERLKPLCLHNRMIDKCRYLYADYKTSLVAGCTLWDSLRVFCSSAWFLHEQYLISIFSMARYQAD